MNESRIMPTLITTLGLAACGGPGASSVPADPTAGCNALYAAIAVKATSCTGTPGDATYLPFAAPSDIRYVCAKAGEAALAGSITYSPSNLAACEQALGGASCADLFGSGGGPLAPCGSVFVGKTPAGGHCPYGFECAAGTTCVDRFSSTSSGCTATCTTEVATGGSCTSVPWCVPGDFCDSATETCQPLPQSGEACTGSCADGLYCKPSGSTGVCISGGGPCVCVPLGTSGPCQYDFECALGYHCAQAPNPQAGTCTAVVREGGACTPGYGDCAGGLYCASGRCTPWPLGPGGACGLLGGEQVPCIDADCNAATDPVSGSFTGTGTCEARVATGGTCSVALTSDTSCVAGDYCMTSGGTSGTCAAGPECM